MPEEEAAEAVINVIQSTGIGALLETYSIWFVVGFFVLFLRNSIENALAGLSVFLGSNYDENMVCYVTVGGTRRPARISKTSIKQTTFYLYEIEDGKILGGSLLSVPNSELSSIMLERPLDRLEI